MPRNRPTPETLDTLHATLLKLEQTDATSDDSKSISELKRVLLNRIADLELAQILEKSPEGATARPTEPADLLPPLSTDEEDRRDRSIKNDD